MENSKYFLKKQPTQERSKFMVTIIKKSATRVLKENGLDGFNTNTVAEIAGVSIGSLYQYFGSKETLIAEIKRDHFQQLRNYFQQAQENLQTSQLGELINAFIDASVKGHEQDPKLHKILSGELEGFKIKEKDNSDDSILRKVSHALTLYKDQLRDNLDIETASELIYHLVEKTVHDTIINQRNTKKKQEQIIAELKTVVLTYLSPPLTT